MKMRKKCRIWWPKELLLSEQSTPGLLFGWFISCSSISLDIVVAFSSSQAPFVKTTSNLQDIIHETNEKISVTLQDNSKFSLLGHCGALTDEDEPNKTTAGDNNLLRSIWSCGCHKFDGSIEVSRQDYIRNRHWVHMLCESHEDGDRGVHLLPRLHHIHWSAEIVTECDVHVITYETPAYGSHHFSLCSWNPQSPLKANTKKPKWVDALHQKKPLNDIDTVILAINCSNAARIIYGRCMCLEAPAGKFSPYTMFLSFIWQLLATVLASVSTLYFVLIRLYNMLSSASFYRWMHIASGRVLKNSSMNLGVRCSQILYWPISLQKNDLRSLSCVEHAEKVAFRRHSMWSNLAVDICFGNLIGLGLLLHTETVCLLISNFVKEFTNDFLRSGCVWLMGVPAGFKLNTELAGVLGMVSLNAIQIWSTLWFFMGPFFAYFIRALAILGIAFGATVPATLVIDIITFATLHVSALHWMITFLYSHQTKALAALWRLFRGQKWNPLRQRLDSYDYTVKQHIVGSLLFTPLLLLLPTTSVFYIFFTIMSIRISSICMLIEVAVAIIHATPYIQIILWLVSRRRFPSGLWFESLLWKNKILGFPENSGGTGALPEKLRQNGTIEKRSFILVSTLRSNCLSLGQILLPHYRKFFAGLSGSSLSISARGILSGRKRMPSTLGLNLPPKMPWIDMPYKDYWSLCRNSILSGMRNDDFYAC